MREPETSIGGLQIAGAFPSISAENSLKAIDSNNDLKIRETKMLDIEQKEVKEVYDLENAPSTVKNNNRR